MVAQSPATPVRERPARSNDHRSNRGALFDALAERVALRVVEMLSVRDRDQAPPLDAGVEPLLNASEVARQLSRSREWVYRNADELGAVRLGSGKRPRLGFDRASVAEYLVACSSGMRTERPEKPSAKRNTRRGTAGANGQGADLLPIRGEAPPQ